MPPGDSQEVRIPFPIRGVERGVPASLQPALTTFDLLNVRALHSGDRIGGGKREGLIKQFANAAGTASARRIGAMVGFNNQPQQGFGEFTINDLIEDGSTLADGEDIGPKFWQYQFVAEEGATLEPEPVNLGGTDALIRVTSGVIAWEVSGNRTLRPHGVIASRPTTNKATLNFEAKSQADGSLTNGDGPIGSPIKIGPAIRINEGSRMATEALHFVLFYAGVANTVTPKIVRRRHAATDLEVWTGSNIVLNGSATPSPLTMTMEEIDAGHVRVVLAWLGGGSGGANISLDETVATEELNGPLNVLSGHLADGQSSGQTRTINSFAVEAKFVSEGVAVKTLLGADANEVGPLQFHLPASYTGFELDESSDVGSADAGPAEYSAEQEWPTIDDDIDKIVASSSFDHVGGIALTAPPPNRRLAMRVQIDDDYSDSVDHTHNFFSRIASDFKSYVRVEFRVTDSGTALAKTGQLGMTHPVGPASVRDAATTTTIDPRGSGADDFTTRVIRPGDTLLFFDTGEDGASQLRIQLNGVTLYDLDVAIDSITYPGLFGSDGASSVSVGFGTPRNASAPAANEALALFWQEIGLAPEGGFGGEGIFGASGFFLAAFTDGNVSVANLDDDELTTLTGEGLLASRAVQAANLGPRIYAVNGAGEAKIIDPVNKTVNDWASDVTANGAGTLPENTKLVAVYRGRLVLAVQPDNPSIWFMSRTLDPLDWDFNAEPLTTAPYAGTNATFGQPGDAIVALIPYLDDYLIFGCAKSMWIMEGDPGYGGRVQNLTRQVGILGARAWCFDENESLYFLGNGGLYRISQLPGRPEHIRPNALIGLLDRIDAGNTLVQLTYDEFRKYVRIFLTPVDGSPGTHVVYDIQHDALFLDQYPADMQPWSAIGGTGPCDDERRTLIGGNDGFIRTFNDAADADDGASINAYFDSAPLQPFGSRFESMVTELNAEGFTGTGEVAWSWYVDESAEEVRVAASPVVTGSWFASGGGFQEPVGLRERGGAHRLRVSQDSAETSFELDSIACLMHPVSRRRGV